MASCRIRAQLPKRHADSDPVPSAGKLKPSAPGGVVAATQGPLVTFSMCPVEQGTDGMALRQVIYHTRCASLMFSRCGENESVCWGWSGGEGERGGGWLSSKTRGAHAASNHG